MEKNESLNKATTNFMSSFETTIIECARGIASPESSSFKNFGNRKINPK